jgi:hypothetical protein
MSLFPFFHQTTTTGHMIVSTREMSLFPFFHQTTTKLAKSLYLGLFEPFFPLKKWLYISMEVA